MVRLDDVITVAAFVAFMGFVAGVLILSQSLAKPPEHRGPADRTTDHEIWTGAGCALTAVGTLVLVSVILLWVAVHLAWLP
jgi:hypothetical protein